MTNYQKMVDEAAGLLRTKSTWAGLQPELWSARRITQEGLHRYWRGQDRIARFVVVPSLC